MLIYLLPIVIISVIFLVYASYSIQSGIYLKALCRNQLKGKTIAITFDDGPDRVQTPKVLDILKEYNITACFFCIGSKIENNEDILLRIKEEGHLIGNHTFNHFFSFPLCSYRQMEKELRDCERKIEEVIGEKTILFRPPFGITNPTIAKVIRAMGYITIGWNIRSLDTCRKEKTILKRIKRGLKPGSVILLHDPLPSSERLLRKILELVKENNYTIERIDKLFDIPKTTI
ncbi:polysaccharide deacetylase family protein [Dysgonomonas sp. Marseille-P4677]|uniref:polysaccharide deacetylase family protein n=1 Tax=Dysgonomonas sp. Marseille-P4677 TaxID=2364790 RepID=UPI0019121DE6|nr:polysaccharide deacetylase family protein [Dysgonomonas sp. Marseille-P4677]MBK5720100.1 polysaccharide deacetylase family protein [Dysgonomonas sp. Marseille-P4677]